MHAPFFSAGQVRQEISMRSQGKRGDQSVLESECNVVM